jgi:hypothetical protein
MIIAGIPITSAAATSIHLTISSGNASEILVEPGAVVPFVVSAEIDSATDNGGLAGISFDLAYDGGDLSPVAVPTTPPMTAFVQPSGLNNPEGFGGKPLGDRLIQVGGAQNTIANDGTYGPFPIGKVVAGVAHQPQIIATGSVTAPLANGSYALTARNVLASLLVSDEPEPEGFWRSRLAGSSNVTPLTIHINQSEGTFAIEGMAGGSSGITRCLTIVPKHQSTCGDAVDVAVTFAGDPPVGTAAFPLAVGDWSEVCIKDRQHTLYVTAPFVTAQDINHVSGVPVLPGGDVNDNGLVDVTDLAVLLATFGQPAVDGGCPWDGTFDADFNNNGVVGVEDYTYMYEHWLALTSCGCAETPAASRTARGSAGRNAIGVAALPPSIAAAADLNGDRRVDYQDVSKFEDQHGLPRLLSRKLQGSR